MKLLKVIVLLTSMVFATNTKASDGKNSFNLLHGMYFGLNSFNRTTVETGYSLYIRNKRSFLYAGAEVGFSSLLIAPKGGLKYVFQQYDKKDSYTFFNAGAEYIHFIQSGNSCPALKPNLGINYFLGAIELNYGYSIPLSSNEGVYFNRHTISLFIRPFIISQL